MEIEVDEDGEYIYEDIPPFILSDSAYSNAKRFVTTFKTTEVTSDHIVCALNKKLGGAGYHVENTFGILKAQFQIFERPLECSLEDIRLAIILVCSTFIIYNFLIDIGDTTDIDEDLVMRVMDEIGLDTEREKEYNELIEDDEIDEDVNITHNVLLRHVLLRHMRYVMEE